MMLLPLWCSCCFGLLSLLPLPLPLPLPLMLWCHRCHCDAPYPVPVPTATDAMMLPPTLCCRQHYAAMLLPLYRSCYDTAAIEVPLTLQPTPLQYYDANTIPLLILLLFLLPCQRHLYRRCDNDNAAVTVMLLPPSLQVSSLPCSSIPSEPTIPRFSISLFKDKPFEGEQKIRIWDGECYWIASMFVLIWDVECGIRYLLVAHFGGILPPVTRNKPCACLRRRPQNKIGTKKDQTVHSNWSFFNVFLIQDEFKDKLNKPPLHHRS